MKIIITQKIIKTWKKIIYLDQGCSAAWAHWSTALAPPTILEKDYDILFKTQMKTLSVFNLIIRCLLPTGTKIFIIKTSFTENSD